MDLNGFKRVSFEDFNFNSFTLIGETWALLTAGNKKDGVNTMTISWGQMGVLWQDASSEKNKILGTPVVTVYVRPQRYTKVFIDKEEKLTLSFFFNSHKKDLTYLGSVSGKDVNKLANTNLTTLEFDGTTAFKEADLIIECEKIYTDQIKESNFINKNILNTSYPLKDFHTFYTCKILNIYQKI